MARYTCKVCKRRYANMGQVEACMEGHYGDRVKALETRSKADNHVTQVERMKGRDGT